MELTYMVRGADGKEYGPATLEQLKAWIREGRMQAQQEIKRSDMGYWAPARSFSEIQGAFTAAGPGTTVQGPAVAVPGAPQPDLAKAAQMRSGASWFYWIAALSLVNSFAAFSGSTWRFIVGLGITQVFDAFASEIGASGKAVALGLDLMAAGVFVVFGVCAHKAQSWAFVVGMVLFALDGLVFLLAQQWLDVGFHVFVLYCLFRGLKGCRALKR